MVERKGWGDVADAWERVFEDIAELGRGVAEDLRRGFDVRTDAEAAFAEDPATEPAGGPRGVDQVQATVARGLDAAKAAMASLSEELTEDGRARALTSEVRGAVGATLAEIGALLTGLSQQLRGGSGDAPGPADAADPTEPASD